MGHDPPLEPSAVLRLLSSRDPGWQRGAGASVFSQGAPGTRGQALGPGLLRYVKEPQRCLKTDVTQRGDVQVDDFYGERPVVGPFEGWSRRRLANRPGLQLMPVSARASLTIALCPAGSIPKVFLQWLSFRPLPKRGAVSLQKRSGFLNATPSFSAPFERSPHSRAAAFAQRWLTPDAWSVTIQIRTNRVPLKPADPVSARPMGAMHPG